MKSSIIRKLLIIGIVAITVTTFVLHNLSTSKTSASTLVVVNEKAKRIQIVTAMSTDESKNFFMPEASSPSSNLGLHTHIWNNLCLKTLDSLCRYPHFPNTPAITEITYKTLITRNHIDDFAQRIFGFIQPPESGFYRFVISSHDSSELWLSSNKDWRNSVLIARVLRVGEKEKISRDRSDIESTQVSDQIHLKKGEKYFIDILHVSGGGLNHLQVLWMRPNRKKPEIIQGNCLSRFLTESDEKRGSRFTEPYNRIPEPISCSKIRKSVKNMYFVYDSTPYLNQTDISNVLPQCSYEPSYLVRSRKLRNWEAVHKHVHNTWSYPIPHWSKVKDLKHWHFNITKDEADSIISKFIAELESKYPR